MKTWSQPNDAAANGTLPRLPLPESGPAPGGALPYLPVFMGLDDRLCLVIGEGELASVKMALLRRAGARVRLVASAPAPVLDVSLQDTMVTQVDGPLSVEHFRDVVLAIDASGDDAVNAQSTMLAKAAGVPINVADRTHLCDFILPAILDRSPVVVAVSTGGLAPAVARLIRQRLEHAIPPGISRIVEVASGLRHKVAERLSAPRLRAAFWGRLFDGAPGELALAGEVGKARQAAERLLDTMAEDRCETGCVFLVGAGPGDPDLLTLRAVRLIQSADVILHDLLVNPAILDMGRREALKICTGKRSGRHSMPQDEINALIVEHARQGRMVVRLKGGDPGIFGRGGEEAMYLREHGIEVHAVPGITAALGCSASAGFPLTHRGEARTLHVVTGHCRAGDELDLDWTRLADPKGTLALYMGRDSLPTLVRNLVAHGLSPDTPAVAIENGTLAHERRIFAPIRDLPEAATALGRGPTLVIVGSVVRQAPGWSDASPAAGAGAQDSLFERILQAAA
jgi:uroporphyrin-III C-methyltransferase/precorrin-2 dehydrogenase/sirohydrochlorin ferrochelatase